MPGTGHSARYKGSISNRVKKSPFQQLAEWNAQLLAADGAVPSIVGGGGLEFKKLDASDIEGVLHNPTKVNLQFKQNAGIQSDGVMKISAAGLLTLDGGSDGLTLASGTGKLAFFGHTPQLLAGPITYPAITLDANNAAIRAIIDVLRGYGLIRT